jgi:hypothetical protein
MARDFFPLPTLLHIVSGIVAVDVKVDAVVADSASISLRHHGSLQEI